ncbi:MAG TPA: cupredoxin domain-containing protein [Steroidobacteraceae bacterium]|nr:cupredoxin domain-containing protein [Steroidobacteraceae bacterium]
MSRIAAPLGLAVLLATGSAWLTTGYAGRAAARAPVTIKIVDFQFSPADVTVEPGTIVEWVNRDQTIHNIILTTAKVSSPGMDTGDHYTFRFDAPGDYPFLCALHPHMTGVIHVKPR